MSRRRPHNRIGSVNTNHSVSIIHIATRPRFLGTVHFSRYVKFRAKASDMIFVPQDAVTNGMIHRTKFIKLMNACTCPAEDFKLVVASTDKIYAAFFSW